MFGIDDCIGVCVKNSPHLNKAFFVFANYGSGSGLYRAQGKTQF